MIVVEKDSGLVLEGGGGVEGLEVLLGMGFGGREGMMEGWLEGGKGGEEGG